MPLLKWRVTWITTTALLINVLVKKRSELFIAPIEFLRRCNVIERIERGVGNKLTIVVVSKYYRFGHTFININKQRNWNVLQYTIHIVYLIININFQISTFYHPKEIRAHFKCTLYSVRYVNISWCTQLY